MGKRTVSFSQRLGIDKLLTQVGNLSKARSKIIPMNPAANQKTSEDDLKTKIHTGSNTQLSSGDLCI